MSSKRPNNHSISTSYTFANVPKTLISKIKDTTLVRSIAQATDGEKLTLLSTRIKPTWICFLSDVLNQNDLSMYENYSDYRELMNKYFNELPLEVIGPKPRGQKYVVNIMNGVIYLAIETVTVVDEKVKRDKKPIDNPQLNTLISAYVQAMLVRFIPTMISKFVECIKENEIDETALPDWDVRFNDFYNYGRAARIDITKEQFLLTCSNMDYWYALNMPISQNVVPFNASSFMAMSSLQPNIGAHLMQHESLVGSNDVMGSFTLQSFKGKMRKVVFRTIDRILEIPLISFQTGNKTSNVDQILDDIFASDTTIIPPKQPAPVSDAKPKSDDDEEYFE